MQEYWQKRTTTTSKARALICSGAPFCRTGTTVWLPPIEWKSLKQWWDFLETVVLLKPEIEASSPPEGWMQVPSSIWVHRLCSNGQNRVVRHYSCKRAAAALITSSDVLVARMPYYETSWCFNAASKKGVPIVLEIHGDWETAILEEDTKTLFRRATRRFRATASNRVLRRMAASSSCVLGIGPRLLEKFVPPHVPSFASTNHLLNEEEYRPRTSFELHTPPRILFVGEMKRRKGLRVLFDSLTKLAKFGHRFEMIMVGAGPMTGELKEHALREGFAEQVTFTGSVPHDDRLYEFFRTSDVLVLPSVAAEGVPRVTHEAMAFGCPVVATDVGSVRWQLESGAGIVIPPGDKEALTSAILEVLRNEDLRKELSGKGYARSLQFTYEKQQAAIASFVSAHIPSVYLNAAAKYPQSRED